MLKLTAIIPDGISLRDEKKYVEQASYYSSSVSCDAVDRDGNLYYNVTIGTARVTFVLDGDLHIVSSGVDVNVQPLIRRAEQLKTPKPAPPKNPLPFASSM